MLGGTRRFGATEGGEGRGHIPVAACLQLRLLLLLLPLQLIILIIASVVNQHRHRDCYMMGLLFQSVVSVFMILAVEEE